MKPMQYKHLLTRALLLLCGAVLAGCNLPAESASTPSMDATQAWQTVQANLTAAVSQTPKITLTTPPSATATLPQPTISTLTPPPSPTQGATNPPTALCDQATAGLPIDVTIPDNTQMQPGETFTKTWRLVNTGTCPWTSKYALVWFSGEQMDAPASVPLEGDIAPGQTADLSVDMQAPQEPGTYISYWKLRNESGALFGIGPSGGSAFWVQIVVAQSATTTITPTAAASTTPTITPTIGVKASGSADLQPGDSLDLDTNQVNGEGEDLNYQVSDQSHLLDPAGDAGLIVFGPNQPSLENCQNIQLSQEPLPVDFLVGSYLCYRTNMALPGWALVTNLDPDKGVLSLQIFTWAIP